MRPPVFRAIAPLYQVGYVDENGSHKSINIRASSKSQAWKQASAQLGAKCQVNTPRAIV